MTFLLKILRKDHINVVHSVYELKKQKKFGSDVSKIIVNANEHGSFAYLSITENLKYLVDNSFLSRASHLKLHFSIDGLPIFKASRLSLWPILMSVKSISYRRPLPIALFCGTIKPKFNDFLAMLSNELRILLQNGFSYKNLFFSFDSPLFIADAPARCLLSGTFLDIFLG